MPPKGKAKSKAKSKGKAKAKARAATAVAEEQLATGAPQGDAQEAVEGQDSKKSKPMSVSLRKKVLADLGDKTIEEAIAEQKAAIQMADATLADAAALTAAQENQVKKLQAEFDKTRAEVEAAISQEQMQARVCKSLREKHASLIGKANEAKKTLLDAQKRVAQLAAMEANFQRVKELEEAKRAAMAATEAAKRDLEEQRQRQKDAWMATRAALQEAKAAKGAGRGVKRTSGTEASPAKARRASGAASARAAEDIE